MSITLSTAHNQWANRPSDQRYQSIEQLAEAVGKRRNLSRAIDVTVKNISAKVIDVGGKETVVLNHGIKQVEPSHWAFGQMAATVKAPAAYLRDLPPRLVAENLNHGLQKYADEVGDRKFMTLIDENGELNTLQAVTSTSYGRIWDADVVSSVQRLNERTGGKFYNPKAYPVGGKFGGEPVPSGLYASDRDVFIFMIDGGSVLDVGPRAQLNRGFIVGNSEVGSKTFWLTTFLFNTVCCNHYIWGAQDIRHLSIRHTRNGPARFDAEAAPTLLEYINSSSKGEEDAIRKAIDYLLPSGKTELVEWVQSKGKFSKGEIMEAIGFANREEGDCRTLWNLVQGFTASARDVAWIDSRADLEMRASALLDIVK